MFSYLRQPRGFYRRLFLLALPIIVQNLIGYVETKNFVSFLKESTSLGVVVVELLAHADKLCALTREYICFHFGLVYKLP